MRQLVSRQTPTKKSGQFPHFCGFRGGPGARSRKLRGACLAILALVSSDVAFAADELPTTISPLQVEPDRNGVNLTTGKITPPTLVLSIPAAPRLKFDRVQNAAPFIKGVQHFDPDTADEMSGEWSLHHIEGASESFRCVRIPESDCQSVTRSGSALDYNGGTYRKAGTGEVYTFNRIHTFTMPSPTDPRRLRHFYASKIEYPDGEIITFTYGTAYLTGYGLPFFRPIQISTNRGYQITVSYTEDDLTQVGWGTPSQATIYKSSAPTVPLARFTYNSDGTITDLAGRIFTGFSPGSLGAKTETADYSEKLPGESANELTISPAVGLPSNAEMIGSIARDGVQWNYSYTDPEYSLSSLEYTYDQITATGPNGYQATYGIAQKWIPNDAGGLGDGPYNVIASKADALNRTTTYSHDTYLRLTNLTLPEGNSVVIAYDAAGNIISKTSTPKAGSGLSNALEQLSYNLAPYTSANGVLNCTTTSLCWRPTWYKDALNRQTDYTYNSLGQMTQELAPADASGVRRQTNITYAASPSGISRKTLVRVCGGANCTGNAESRTEYTYWGDTDLPSTVTQKDEATGETRTTTYSYDDAGRVLSIDGPLSGTNDAEYFRYDSLGRKTWEIGKSAPNGTRLAKKLTYRDADDKVVNVKSGRVSSPTDVALVQDFETDTSYDSRRYPIREKTFQGANIFSVTDRSFLDRGLADCSTVRMNLAALPAVTATGACALGSAGAQGADRITKNVYDAAGQLTKIQKAYSTSLQQDYVTYAYTSNGKQQYVTDANGNKAQFAYDGFDRLSTWYFPSKTTVGTVNNADYEQYGYGAAGNRTSLRKRDGSTLTFSFDGLNRITVKTVPSRAGLTAAQTRSVYYSYDLIDRQLAARFDSSSGADRVQNSFNGFGETTASTLVMGTLNKQLTSLYDLGGRRTRITHPDNQAFTYAYDALDRATNIYEGTGTTTALETFTYNDDGTIASRSEGSGASSASYAWDNVGRLTSQSDVIGGTGANVSWNFTLNPASQIASEARTETNNAYAYAPVAAVNRSYTVNGLNQYSAVAGNTYSYDANGNLTGDGINSYTYDIENRLVKTVGGGNTTNVTYDPLGRMVQVDRGTSNSTTKFLYDGDAMVGEFDNSNALTRRYVHGANGGADDPLVLYYLGGQGGTRRYLHADHLGSIVGVTSSDGSSYAKNSYDEYGVPGSANFGRFQYTGQAYIDWLGLYYYKARFYSPMLGRFMQTDPIGYDDQVNLYAYVGNDPVNGTDPSGTCFETSCPVNPFNPEASELTRQAEAQASENVAMGLYEASGAKAMVDAIRSPSWSNVGLAAMGLTPVGKVGRLVIGKIDDLGRAGALLKGEFTLGGAGRLSPGLGSAKADWLRNARELRSEMRRGQPIRDASVDPKSGALRSNTGFLKAERNLLKNRGWRYSADTKSWNPPARSCIGSRLPGGGRC